MDLNAWLAAGAGTAAAWAATALVVAAVTGAALASWGRFPLWVGVVVCALVPLVGPAVLAVVALARSRSAVPPPTWLDRGRWTVRGLPLKGRRFRLGLLGAGLAALAALLVVPVARLHAGAAFSTPVLLTALPTGGTVLAAAFALAVVVAALAARRTTRLGAVGGAVLGGVWTAAAAAVLLLSVPLTGVLHLADRYVGNVLGGIVLSLLQSYDVPAADIAGGLRESVSTRLDAGPWVALAGGLLLLAWSVAEAVAARRAARTVVVVRQTVPAAAAAPTDVWSF